MRAPRNDSRPGVEDAESVIHSQPLVRVRGVSHNHGIVRLMYMAYVDETGDTGALTKAGASACYALGCVLIKVDKWPSTYEALVQFRRMLRDRKAVNVRWELKANYLIRNSGPLRKLALQPQDRRWIYREHLRLLHPMGAEAFGVVVDKAKTGTSGDACFHMAWETLIQRLERTIVGRRLG